MAPRNRYGTYYSSSILSAACAVPALCAVCAIAPVRINNYLPLYNVHYDGTRYI